MLTYKFILAKNNSLRLRLTNNRKSAEISLGLQLTQEELDNALSSNAAPKYLSRRKYLLGVLTKLENAKMEMIENGRINEDVKIVKESVSAAIFNIVPEDENKEPENEYNFVRWYMEFAETHTTPGSKTKACYLHTLSRMRDYRSDIDKLDFADISVKWLEGFDAFLAKTCKVNSRNHHFRNIRAVFKYAIRHDLDIRNPFDRMKLKKEETEKRALTVEELRWIFNSKVEPYAEIYRDMFILSFMLIGINPIDLYRLSAITSSGRINYRRAKTHKLYSIKVEPEAMEIIKKYKGANALLSIADRWQRHDSFGKAANKALQLLGAPAPAPGRSRQGKSKFHDLTLYVARHSWATIAAELDIPDAVISQALGHSSDTNSTTAIYIKRNEKKVDEANRRVLDWVLYGKC